MSGYAHSLSIPRPFVIAVYALLIIGASAAFVALGIHHLEHGASELTTSVCFIVGGLYLLGGSVLAPVLLRGLERRVKIDLGSW